MKKGLLVLVLAAIVAGGAFALPKFGMSLGVGGLVGGDFGGGYETSYDYGYGKEEFIEKNPYFGGGGFIFVDATYAELTLAFFGGGGTSEQTSKETGDPDYTTKDDFSVTSFNIGLLLKYPFEVGEKLSVFPLLGFDYAIAITVKIDGKEPTGLISSGDFSAFWFKLGGGLDFKFTDKLFLRGEVLYGIRLENEYESLMVEWESASGWDAKSRLGHGLTAKIALGYKLF